MSGDRGRSSSPRNPGPRRRRRPPGISAAAEAPRHAVPRQAVAPADDQPVLLGEGGLQQSPDDRAAPGNTSPTNVAGVVKDVHVKHGWAPLRVLLFGAEGFFREWRNARNLTLVLLAFGFVAVTVILVTNATGDDLTVTADLGSWIIDTGAGRAVGALAVTGVFGLVAGNRRRRNLRERDERRLSDALRRPPLATDKDQT
jgi:hypothetical protein